MSKSRVTSAIARIEQLYNKKSVTIYLDGDGTSPLARQDEMYSYEKKNKILEINVPKLSAGNKELLFKIIRKVHEDGGLLWKDTKKETLVSYSKYNASNKNSETLEFFSGIIPPADYNALKMAFFLRYNSDKGLDIHTYKMDIINKFGDRGKNIANLCSAGYFEDEFKPLYLSSTRPTFSKYYEMVVGDGARALFVNMKMNVDSIAKEVEVMVVKAIKYHMDDFRIHAKGAGNVTTIKKFVDSVLGQKSYVIIKVWEDSKIKAIEYLVTIKR
jgi:ribosome recycling factor